MPASDRPDTEAAERRYEEAAAKVDLSDLAVVKRHVYTANPKEWPKPLLYALLAALASEKQRADNAQETSRLTDQQLDYMRDRLAAAEQVIEAAERFMDEPPSLELAAAFRAELANYHTAITEPGAEP